MALVKKTIDDFVKSHHLVKSPEDRTFYGSITIELDQDQINRIRTGLKARSVGCAKNLGVPASSTRPIFPFTARFVLRCRPDKSAPRW